MFARAGGVARVRGIQVDAAVCGMLRSEYPHVVRKVVPVNSLMIKQALEDVDVVQLPAVMSLVDGEWLTDIRLDHLRNAAFLTSLNKLGRRVVHGVAVLQEHSQFARVELGHKQFSISLKVQMVLGKGSTQSQQACLLMSKVYSCEDPDQVTSNKMRRDPVMLVLLLLYLQNGMAAIAWADVLRQPKMVEFRSKCPVFPHLTDNGVPTGVGWPLRDAQFAFNAILHVAGYPGCTAPTQNSACNYLPQNST